jgi:predicted lipase
MWLHTLFLLATTLSAFTVTTAFDAPLVNLALNISQAAYCLPDTEGPSAWDCATCTPEVTHATTLVTRGELAVFGYIAARDMLFVGYRGSTNIQNWIDNLHVRQESPYRDADVGVEHGMYSVYASMRTDVLSTLNNMVSKYGTRRLLITGHSLGGALATLTAFDLLYSKAPFVVDDLITFGSPRVGNEQFAQYFEQFDVRITRATHYRDIVPHVPETFLGYEHVRGEVWFNEPSTAFMECKGDEDPNCSNSCAPLHCTSVSDHLLYLDVAMGSDGDC